MKVKATDIEADKDGKFIDVPSTNFDQNAKKVKKATGKGRKK